MQPAPPAAVRAPGSVEWGDLPYCANIAASCLWLAMCFTFIALEPPGPRAAHF